MRTKQSAAANCSKVELYPKKILLSVWWNFKGVLYNELLSAGRTIDVTVHWSQLNKLSNILLKKKQPEIVSHKGIAFHPVINNPQKLLNLDLNVFPDLPQSLDMVLFDYHLFR